MNWSEQVILVTGGTGSFGKKFVEIMLQEYHPKRLVIFSRDELKQHLEAHRIGCALHYPLPLHLQKCYASLGYKAGDFPVAEKAARECLSLPIYPELTDAQIQRSVAVIKDFFQRRT